MAIATTAEYKVWAGISGSTYDSVIAVVIAGVQKEMEDYCGRIFDYQDDAVEFYDGTDTDYLVLANVPIRTIASIKLVTYSGSAVPTVLYTYPSTAYNFDTATGVLRLLGGSDSFIYDDERGIGAAPVFERAATTARFPAGHRNIQVMYEAGYGSSPATYTMPDSLKLALYKLVDMQMALRGKDTSLASENLGQYSYTRASGSGGNLGDYQKMLASLMAPWRRLGVVA